jgi:hypothetical protein
MATSRKDEKADFREFYDAGKLLLLSLQLSLYKAQVVSDDTSFDGRARRDEHLTMRRTSCPNIVLRSGIYSTLDMRNS